MDFTFFGCLNREIQLKQIVIVVGSSVVAGAEKQSLLLAKQLRLKFHVEMVFLGKPGPFIEVARKYGFNVWSSKGTVVSDLITIFRCLNKVNPTCQINFLYRADVLGGLLGKLLGVKIIINSARNTYWPNFNFRKKILLQFISRLIPSHIVANSKYAEIWHINIGYPKSKFAIIPNFLPTEWLSGSPKKNFDLQSPLRLGIASRAVIGKGHRALIDAVKILQTIGVRCEVWFKGYGILSWDFILEEKEKGLIQLNLQDGELDLSKWFKEIDIYCGISENWESDSNCINEAILNKVPLIVSELIPHTRYQPEPPQVKAGVPTSIALGILEILETPNRELKEDLNLREQNLIQSRDAEVIENLWLGLIQ